MTIDEMRLMNRDELEKELNARAKELENLGMSHDEVSTFMSDIMGLGIATYEKFVTK